MAYPGFLSMPFDPSQQGMLGGMGQPPGVLNGAGNQSAGLLGGLLGPGPHPFASALGDRSAALLGFGLPLLLSHWEKDALPAAMAGLQGGQQMDFARRQAKDKRDREAQQQAAYDKLAAQLGYGPGLPGDVVGPLAVAAMKPPAPPEPFTLSPGQTRYGGDGRPLASVPANPNERAPTVQDFWDENKQVIVKRQWNGTGWTDIGYGRPPTNTSFTVDPQSGVVTYTQGPGVKADKAATAARQHEVQQADIVLTDIDRVLDMDSGATLPTTGLVGSILKDMPGTAAHDINKTLDTIRANVGFGQLNQMRQSSPTGGALGQVTVRELELLQAALGNLEQSPSHEVFVYNLKRLKNLYLDIVHGEGQGPPREDLGQTGVGQPAAPAGPSRQDLYQRYQLEPPGGQP